MIQPKDFIETLRAGGIEFFAGVPDSLLKNLCAYITDSIARENNIIAAIRNPPHINRAARSSKRLQF